MTDEQKSHASRGLTSRKAVLLLLLNTLVLPGLGAWISGREDVRKTGRLQVIFGIVILPLAAVIATSAAILNGVDPERAAGMVKSGLYALFVPLFLWSFLTGIRLLRKTIEENRGSRDAMSNSTLSRP